MAGSELSQTIDYGIVTAELETKVAADLVLTIDGVDDRAGYKAADTRRKEWVKIRTGIDRRRKELNALAREHIKKVDAVAAELTTLAGTAEDHVTKLVDGIDAQVEKAKQDKLDAAFDIINSKLQAAGIVLDRIVVESLTPEDIEQRISEKLELDRLRAAEAERMAAATAEAERATAAEVARMKADAERLAVERAEFERQKAAQAAELAELRALRAEQERKAAEAADKTMAEQRAAEKLIRDTEAERLKAEFEQAAAVRAEGLKPDREKLLAFADAIDAIKCPDVTPELQRVRALCVAAVAVAVAAVRDYVAQGTN